MEVKLIIFGQLQDITGSDTLVLTDVKDTDTMITALNKKYPGFSTVRYMIAVDKKMIKGNASLHENAIIALMPPFSGG